MNRIPVAHRVLLVLAFMALLAVASLIPGRAEPGDSIFVWAIAKTPKLLQKTLHVGLYGVLAMLWVWTLESVPSKSNRVLIGAVAAVAFGAAMEWAQTRVPGRFGTAFDVILDATGVAIGMLAAIVLL